MGERQPEVSRPHGYWDLDAPAPLPWAWAVERLDRARNYWLSTTRKDGHPRSRPVWGVWLDDAFLFDSGSSVEILEANPAVEVHLESGDEVVIIQGVAERVTDLPTRTRFVDALNPKYQWTWKPEDAPAPYTVRPRKAFGWMSDPSGADGGALFGETGTRWTFSDG